jgi:hypothetical protein
VLDVDRMATYNQLVRDGLIGYTANRLQSLLSDIVAGVNLDYSRPAFDLQVVIARTSLDIPNINANPNILDNVPAGD